MDKLKLTVYVETGQKQREKGRDPLGLPPEKGPKP